MPSYFNNIIKISIIGLLTGCQTIIVPQSQINERLNVNLKATPVLKSDKLPSQLSMSQAKALAIEENPSLQAAGQRIIRAKAIINQAKALYYPTITANGSAIHKHHSPESLTGLETRPYENYSTSLNSQWLIFDGFSRDYKVLAAEYGKVASTESYKDSQRLLIDAVSQAFYQTILAKKEMNINQEIKSINQDFLKDTKIKLEAGTATKTELNNFIVNVNDSQIAYLNAKNSFDTAKMALAELIGFPNVDIESFETTYKNTEINIPKIDTAIGIALNHRPDLKSLQAQILTTEAQINEANGEYYPKVYLEGSYGGSTFDDFKFGDNNRESYYGASVNWNLFTGNSTAALIEQRKAEKKELLELLKSQWHEVISQIRQQHRSLENTIERVKVQTNSAALSKSIYEDTKEVYENGATTITRVNEVLTDYSIASLNQVLFEVEALRRNEVLRALMGKNID